MLKRIITLKAFVGELWLNRSAFDPLLLPVCIKQGAKLVSISGSPLAGAARALLQCSQKGDTTIILCLSDLSLHGFTFCRDLAQAVARENYQDERDIRLKHVALTPDQVLERKIPMVPGEKGQRKQHALYKSYLRPYGLDARRMAELDALEAYSPDILRTSIWTEKNGYWILREASCRKKAIYNSPEKKWSTYSALVSTETTTVDQVTRDIDYLE